MLKKNKMYIFIFLLFSFVVLFLTTVSFADSESISSSYNFIGFDNEEYSLPLLPQSILDCDNYITVIMKDSGYIYCIGFNCDVDISWSTGNIKIAVVDSGYYLTEYFLRSINDGGWCSSSSVNPTSFIGASTCTVIDTSDDLLVYKSKFISQDDFFLTPLHVVLAPVMKETPLEGVLQEIMDILQIILVIIVGLIGLRKALKMLSTVLHRS